MSKAGHRIEHQRNFTPSPHDLLRSKSDLWEEQRIEQDVLNESNHLACGRGFGGTSKLEILEILPEESELRRSNGRQCGIRAALVPVQQPDLVLFHDHLSQVRGAELCRQLKPDPGQEVMYGRLDPSLVRKFSGMCISDDHFPVKARSILASSYA